MPKAQSVPEYIQVREIIHELVSVSGEQILTCNPEGGKTPGRLDNWRSQLLLMIAIMLFLAAKKP